MADSKDFHLTLTPEQKERIRETTGMEADTLELSVEELEERIAPAKRGAIPRGPKWPI